MTGSRGRDGYKCIKSEAFIKDRNDLRLSEDLVALILIDVAVFDNLKDCFVFQRFGSPGLQNLAGIHICRVVGKCRFINEGTTNERTLWVKK